MLRSCAYSILVVCVGAATVEIDSSAHIKSNKMMSESDSPDDLHKVVIPVTWDGPTAKPEVLVGRAAVPSSFDANTPVVAIFPNYAGLKGLEYHIARWWT